MRVVIFILNILFLTSLYAVDYKDVTVGAERMNQYLPMLKGKRVALVANHTAVVNGKHLVDTLLKRDVNLVKIFAPEHGFRGLADAGSTIKNSVDTKTGLPVISLYGKNKKPTPEQLKNVDVVVFDIQDVGARFYTYISTMHLVMEACAENEIKMIVLDRPNPNGFYVDGPVLDPKLKSFIGMHTIPIVHGMTVAELATMINGELWLEGQIKCNLSYILCDDYTHRTLYKLPIKPSPNLPNMTSIYYYPTLCLLEGTAASVGRGTEKPFQYVGHPKYKNGQIKFTPVSTEGARNPKWKNEQCIGFDVNDSGLEPIFKNKQLLIGLLIDTYNNCPKEKFFRSSFNKLAGNDVLKQQLIENKTEQDIRQTWQEKLNQFKKIRKQYLLYEDFE